MTKHTPREMKVSDRSLWGDTPFCSQVRMARIIEHSPMNGMDADHLANEMARRWNCHAQLLYCLEELLAHIEWRRKNAGETAGPNDCTHRARAAIERAKGDAA